jgi:hypothetical protein
MTDDESPITLRLTKAEPPGHIDARGRIWKVWQYQLAVGDRLRIYPSADGLPTTRQEAEHEADLLVATGHFERV